MNTLEKINDIKSNDIIDKLIFEKGLRIKNLFIEHSLNLMIVVLSNKKILNISLSEYPKLHFASLEQLNRWNLISDGIGIEWEELDEDLSLKGFIQTYVYQTAIQTIQQNEVVFV